MSSPAKAAADPAVNAANVDSHHRVTILAAPADIPESVVTLADGSQVTIRVLRQEDADLERDFIRNLSPESRRMRFLGQIVEPSPELIRKLTELDYRQDMAFIALAREAGQIREIGVSRYSLAPDGKSCECAVTVSDAWQGKGLGTTLMRDLIGIARRRGVRSMFSIDASDNERMRQLARALGFKRTLDPADPARVIHRITL